MTVHLWFLVAALLLAVGGCAKGPSPSFEAFSRNRLEVLARMVESASLAQRAAVEQLVSGHAAARTAAAPGRPASEAYDVVRRELAISESRVRSSHNRLRTLRNSGVDFFQRWGTEITAYEDTALRDAARQTRREVKARFEEASSAMGEAQEAFAAPVEMLHDRMLFVRHSRSRAVLPELPAGTKDPGPALALLVERSQRAWEAAAAFAASAVPPPAGHR
jgi:hypothetical protein